jgi:hypothetical protein
MKLDRNLAPSFLPWVVQQFCAPFVTFLAVVSTSGVPRALNFGQATPALENWWTLAITSIVGFVLGFLVNRLFPRVAEDGRLIWILPLVTLALFVISDLLRKNNADVLNGYFFPHGEGEDGIAFVLFTIPTLACISYTIGVVIGRARFSHR